MAAELGLDDLRSEMADLSGGQRTRAALAAIELARVDVLLLDEPTNDLDAEALERLEAFVQAFAGGIVVVLTIVPSSTPASRLRRARPVHASGE